MSTFADRKRKREGGPDRKPPRKPVSKKLKLKRAKAYHSSSEDEAEPIKNRTVARKVADIEADSEDDLVDAEEDDGVQLPNLIDDLAVEAPEEADEADSASTDGSGAEDDDEDEDGDEQSDIDSRQPSRKVKKRNDPEAFSTSISKILDSKLTSTKRSDPVLSRSKDASQAQKELTESKLEEKARRKLKEDKRSLLDKGHVRDIMGLESTDVSTGAIAEHEKVLKKMAQRGVVKLFNAVRAAQVKAEEASREARAGGVVGADQRNERVNEMSKAGFLSMLAGEGNAK